MTGKRHHNTMWLIEWIERMSGKYSGIVHGADGRTYDWGQALAREMYGQNWAVLDIPDDPSDADVRRAIQWERGDWPAWVEVAT